MPRRIFARPHHEIGKRNCAFRSKASLGDKCVEMGSLVRFRGTNSQDGDTWHLAEIDYILSQANHSPFDRMLDLGCGDGGRVRTLNLRGYKNSVGLDALQTNIEVARRRSAKGTQQVSFIQADPLHCPFADRSFDEVGDFEGSAFCCEPHDSPAKQRDLATQGLERLRSGIKLLGFFLRHSRLHQRLNSWPRPSPR